MSYKLVSVSLPRRILAVHGSLFSLVLMLVHSKICAKLTSQNLKNSQVNNAECPEKVHAQADPTCIYPIRRILAIYDVLLSHDSSLLLWLSGCLQAHTRATCVTTGTRPSTRPTELPPLDALRRMYTIRTFRKLHKSRGGIMGSRGHTHGRHMDVHAIRTHTIHDTRDTHTRHTGHTPHHLSLQYLTWRTSKTTDQYTIQKSKNNPYIQPRKPEQNLNGS